MNTSPSRFLSRLPKPAAVLIVLACAVSLAAAAERSLETRLVWGTNHEKPEDPTLKPLDGTLAKKLGNLPLKFPRYFEVNRQTFAINDKAPVKVEMSKQCYLEVMDKGEGRVNVKLYGEGKLVNQVTQPLPKGETLAIAGNSKDGGAWLVTLQPVEPPKPKPAPTLPKAPTAPKGK